MIALVLGLVTKVILDWLMRAPAMGPSIDAEGEVSSRRGHLRPLLPILPPLRASQRCIRVLHFEPIGREAGAGIQVLGQTAVSTNTYIVSGWAESTCRTIHLVALFPARARQYDPEFSSSGSRHASDPHCTSRQACGCDRRRSGKTSPDRAMINFLISGQSPAA